MIKPITKQKIAKLICWRAKFIFYLSKPCQNFVEDFTRTHDGRGFFVVRLIVAAEVNGLALHGEEFGNDALFVGGEFLREGGGIFDF